MLPSHGLPKILPKERASIATSVVPGHQPSTTADQPHNRGMFQQKTTPDSRLQSHGKPECTLRLVPGIDDCRADHAAAESDVLGRWQSPSPTISSQAHHLHAAQHCVSTFPMSAPQQQLFPQKTPSLTALPSLHQWKDRVFGAESPVGQSPSSERVRLGTSCHRRAGR